LPDRILTLRDLNRATLHRQLLLERAPLSVPATIEKLVGLQAQLPVAPYVGLWTRLPDFQREHLAALLENRTIIKTTFLRATLHLVTAEDYRLLRATLQPVLTSAWETVLKERASGLDVAKLIETARAFIAEKPRTFADITKRLTEWMPNMDEGAMRYGVRTHLPLVQVPIDKGWSYPGNPQFTLAETWLNTPIPVEENLQTLIRRYLAAFGPATVADIKTWSGLALPALKAAIEPLKAELVVYRDEKKRELFDLPDMPVPDGDAPERFLPEFDNILLSHDKRTRILADEYRKKVYLPGLRVAATFLVDGFVRGVWKTETKKGTATLMIEPFTALTAQNRAALTAEAEKLVRFVESDAKAYEVKFVE
jgi:hypothetical protein